MIRRLFMKRAAAVPLMVTAINARGMECITEPYVEPVRDLEVMNGWFDENFDCYQGVKRAYGHCMVTGERFTYRVFGTYTDKCDEESRAHLVETFMRGFKVAHAAMPKKDDKPTLYWRRGIEVEAIDFCEFDAECDAGTATQRGRVIRRGLKITARLAIPAIDYLLAKLDTVNDENAPAKHVGEVLI